MFNNKDDVNINFNHAILIANDFINIIKIFLLIIIFFQILIIIILLKI